MADEEKRFFTTLPNRAIADTNLTALDLRCLAVIALHDGMSAVSGKGGGCFARNATLAALARTDVTNFSKALSRLMTAKYVSRDPQLMDRRRFTLRVQYDRDTSWRVGQPLPEQVDPETGEIVGQDGANGPEVVGDAEYENGSFSKGSDRDYISLNEELHSDESEELDSAKRRTLEFQNSVPPLNLSADREINPAEAGLPKVSLSATFPANFNELPSEAQVACIARGLKSLGNDADAVETSDRMSLSDLLWSISDAFCGEPVGHQAERLHEQLAVY